MLWQLGSYGYKALGVLRCGLRRARVVWGIGSGRGCLGYGVRPGCLLASRLGEVGVYPTTNSSFSVGALVTSLLPFSLAVVVEW